MKNSSCFFAGLLVLAGLLLTGFSGRAQVFSPPAPTTIRPDTTEARQVDITPEAKRSKAAADSTKRTEHMFRAFGYQGIRLTRPGKAALLAAILPGAGQIYNRKWWKLPLVYGSLGGVIYGEYYNQKYFRQFADAYNIVAANPAMLGKEVLGDQAMKARSLDILDRYVIVYRGQRDIFYLYIGIAYSLQIVDALVDAHLKDFDVSEDLSLHWEPTLLAVPGRALALPTAPGVMFALRVK